VGNLSKAAYHKRDKHASEEEARYLYYNLEAVICLLKQVPADTRELSISYAEHIRNIEQYFQGIVSPVNAVQLQTLPNASYCRKFFPSLLASFTISSSVCSITTEHF